MGVVCKPDQDGDSSRSTSLSRDKLPSTCDHLCIDPLLPALNQGPFGTSKVGFGCHEVVLLSSFSLPPRNANLCTPFVKGTAIASHEAQHHRLGAAQLVQVFFFSASNSHGINAHRGLAAHLRCTLKGPFCVPQMEAAESPC